MSDPRDRKLPDGEELVWADPTDPDPAKDPRSSACERRRIALGKEPVENPTQRREAAK